MKKDYVKFVGDIHGQPRLHREAINGSEYSVQIGDLGFNYDYLSNIDSKRHRFFGGNHDNYDVINEVDHNLGNFGVVEIPEFGEFFFARGGWSIDHSVRTKHDVVRDGKIIRHKNMWDEEEMSMSECNEALDLYKKVKPKILVSHECPLNIVQYLTNPSFAESFGYGENVIKTKTNQLLQAMTDFHRPRVHIFGHFHVNFDNLINGVTGETMPPEGVPEDHLQYFTRYVCLGEGNTIGFPKGFVDTL